MDMLTWFYVELVNSHLLYLRYQINLWPDGKLLASNCIWHGIVFGTFDQSVVPMREETKIRLKNLSRYITQSIDLSIN